MSRTNELYPPEYNSIASLALSYFNIVSTFSVSAYSSRIDFSTSFSRSSKSNLSQIFPICSFKTFERAYKKLGRIANPNAQDKMYVKSHLFIKESTKNFKPTVISIGIAASIMTLNSIR